MAALQLEATPADVGFDAARLARTDTHFRRYVDDGRLPGWLLAVSRRGKLVHVGMAGKRYMEAGLPVADDTVFRIYSMTKPITSVAAMMLYERGAFELKDPVSDFIPSFADMAVYRQGNPTSPVVEPATEPVRIWHLLSHTAGLTYGFHNVHPVDAMYRNAGFEWGTPPGLDLAVCCDRWAEHPLVFQPGTEWNYSVCTDVLGRVVEVASGMSLDAFFATEIFEPLGMDETGFWADDRLVDRLAALYWPDPETGLAARFDAMGNVALAPPSAFSGGGGLVSTVGDYQQFVQMLAAGGELNGERLLGPRTVRYMATNHLPGNVDLEQFGRPLFAETTYDGIGFGLGFSVMLDPAANKTPASVGEFVWGGAASTAFWVDPVEDITAIFMTQLLPSSTHPIRTQFRQLVMQAIVD